MHRGDWVLLGIFIFMTIGFVSLNREDREDKAEYGAAYMAIIGTLLIIDQSVEGHSGWIMAAGIIGVVVGLLALIALTIRSEAPA